MISGYLLGGAVGADRTAVGQTLLAHPAVAASLSGWMVGAPSEGIWLGLVLSLLSHSHLPLGHEGLRDYASVAVAVPIALGAGAPSSDWGVAMLGGVLIAAPLARAIHALRELSRRVQARAREMAEAGQIPPVESWHFGLAGLHFARGILAVFLASAVLRAVLDLWHGLAGETELRAMAWLWMMAPLLGVPSLLRARRRAVWYLPGLVLGAGLWWVLGGGR